MKVKTSIASPLVDDALDAILAVASRVVEQARARGADAAEAFVQTAVGRSIGIEKDALSSASQAGEAGIGLRVIKARRVGFAYTSGPEGVAAAVEAALAGASRATPGDLELPGRSETPRVPGLWDKAIVEREPQADVEDARRLIEAARATHPGVHLAGGSIGHGAEASAIANSEGLEAAHRITHIGMGGYTVAKAGDEVATGHYSHEATTLDEKLKDPAAIGREAGERAALALGAVPYERSDNTTVVFTPESFASLLEFMVLPAFIGERAARGESVYAGRENEQVVDPRLRLTDDPTRAGGLGAAPTDDEGVASQRVPLLADGRLGPFLFDAASAYRYGAGKRSMTASALRTGGLNDGRSYQDPPTALPRNIILETTDAKPLEQLLASIDDGILVLDVLGAHTGNRTSGDFSVTTTQLWRIEHGERTVPLKGAMLSGNLPTLLLENLYSASREREQIGGHFSPTGLDLPHIAFRDVTATGS